MSGHRPQQQVAEPLTAKLTDGRRVCLRYDCFLTILVATRAVCFWRRASVPEPRLHVRSGGSAAAGSAKLTGGNGVGGRHSPRTVIPARICISHRTARTRAYALMVGSVQ